MRGAPASYVANTPGMSDVGILTAVWKPASFTREIIWATPVSTPRPSAAIVGFFTQSCNRATASPWRFSISA